MTVKAWTLRILVVSLAMLLYVGNVKAAPRGRNEIKEDLKGIEERLSYLDRELNRIDERNPIVAKEQSELNVKYKVAAEEINKLDKIAEEMNKLEKACAEEINEFDKAHVGKIAELKTKIYTLEEKINKYKKARKDALQKEIVEANNKEKKAEVGIGVKMKQIEARFSNYSISRGRNPDEEIYSGENAFNGCKIYLFGPKNDLKNIWLSAPLGEKNKGKDSEKAKYKEKELDLALQEVLALVGIVDGSATTWMAEECKRILDNPFVNHAISKAFLNIRFKLEYSTNKDCWLYISPARTEQEILEDFENELLKSEKSFELFIYAYESFKSNGLPEGTENTMWGLTEVSAYLVGAKTIIVLLDEVFRSGDDNERTVAKELLESERVKKFKEAVIHYDNEIKGLQDSHVAVFKERQRLGKYGDSLHSLDKSQEKPERMESKKEGLEAIKDKLSYIEKEIYRIKEFIPEQEIAEEERLENELEKINFVWEQLEKKKCGLERKRDELDNKRRELEKEKSDLARKLDELKSEQERLPKDKCEYEQEREQLKLRRANVWQERFERSNLDLEDAIENRKRGWFDVEDNFKQMLIRLGRCTDALREAKEQHGISSNVLKGRIEQAAVGVKKPLDALASALPKFELEDSQNRAGLEKFKQKQKISVEGYEIIEKIERAIDDIVAKMGKQADICNKYEKVIKEIEEKTNQTVSP